MDKYLVTLQPTTKNPNSIRRCRWKRSVVELNGRFEPNYRHDLSTLLMQSYYEVGRFSHLYSLNGLPCQTHMNQIVNTVLHTGVQIPVKKQGLSALEFDSKGIYLASVTKSGCLTVHDFEVLYCQSQTKDSSPCLQENENKILVHLSMPLELDSVRWNPSNQDEVVCTSMKSDEVLIFDIGYVSSEPTEVLKTRRTATAYGSYICKGLSDIAFTKTDDSRLIASDTNGVLHVWDKRMSFLPCLEFTTNSYGTINTIQLNVDNQVIFGAGKQGIIYSWDLRGGKTSAMFQTQNVVRYPPLTSLKLSSMLERIGPLKAQSNIVSKEIHSINLDPSCPHQLAFHLDDGWSGVLDLHNLEVTHIHCPPPAWLNGSSVWDDQLHLRKPTWLPTYSIYAVGSSSENGIHLLDFYPHASSPSHVYNEDIESLSRDKRRKQHQFIPTSEAITACVAHPLNGAIVAGTKQSSLLMVSQRGQSFEG